MDQSILSYFSDSFHYWAGIITIYLLAAMRINGVWHVLAAEHVEMKVLHVSA